MKNKKVLFVAPIPFFYERGACLKVRDIATVLAEQGFEVDILTYPNGRDLNIKNVKTIRIDNFISDPPLAAKMSLIRIITDFKLLLKARSLGKEKLGEYSLIITKTPIGALIGIQAKKFLKVPMISDMNEPITFLVKKYTTHNLMTGGFAKVLKLVFSLKLVIKMVDKLGQYILDNVDYIFSNWNLSAEEFKQLLPNSRQEDITILYSAILYDNGGAEKSIEIPELKKNLHLLENKKIIGYVGGFESYQGVDIKLKAIANTKLKDVVFVVAGNYDDYHYNLAKKLNILDKVIFLGRVKHDQLDYLYSKTDLLLTAHDIPGDCGASSKIIEYMLKNKPVVATDNPLNRQILTENEVYYAQRTPEGFTKAIEEVFEDYEKAKKKAQVAYDYSNKKFGKTEFENKIKFVLNKLGLI